ncbi:MULTISPECIES: restriction endonuclease subunit S [Enterobacteriaceae]|uniref:restriction endonuclease subunit S n=1 Tax=Enterobacteriaceae TaxID=543 RepID=UPI00107CD5D5|nr:MULTISPECIES: restriction endonuclease subunit S [Enterobacteriaceae]EAA9776845.1 restriction endonuclease subunit S [Salmonella enterica]EBP9727579.1 restriction endonuclease subunit S [Salmonella enterica]MBG0662222.1 restriction endonuclease subunit S [Enterobacter roggenkampii]QMI06334.1 restriction endonuclease subunit S [Citrobacter sp. RHB25-C09]
MSYKEYSEYKNSGVEWLGVIPSSWRILSAKRLFGNRRTVADDADEQLAASQKYGVIPQKLMIEKTGSKVALALKGTGSFRKVHKNDFVISLRSFEGGIEYSAYDGCISPAYTVLYPLKNINVDYYRFLKKSSVFVSALQATTDSLRDGKAINYEQYCCIDLPFPSIEEQECIASFLDCEIAKVDCLIGKQEQLIEFLKEKRQAVISHSITKGLNADVKMKYSGIEWLGDIPEHWNVIKFSYCVSIRSGLVDPKSEQYKKYWLIAPNHIQSGEGRILNLETAEEQGAESSKYLCKKGEVIYSKIRPALAKVCISPGNNVLCSADMYPMTARSGLTNDYLSWFLLSSIFTRFAVNQADRVAMPKINRESLAECKIPFPGKSEQIEIAYYLQRITKNLDDLIVKSQESIHLLKERRSTLISAAVTGKIDVRKWQPDAKDVA